MSDLVTFLLAQLDADEAAARAATPGPWKVSHLRHDFRDGSFCEAWGIDAEGDEVPVEIGMDRDYYTPEAACGRVEDAEHIARHDPARVLAEVAAKRAIVAAYQSDYNDDLYGGCGDDCEWKALGYVLRALASVYEGAPGWQEEWR